jgi:hypothetical protein
MVEEKFLEVRLVGGIGEKFWECMPQRMRHYCFGRRLRGVHSAQPAASFLRKEGGLSGRLKIWQSALQ